MPATIYQQRVVCDNCGRLVSQRTVDGITFERLSAREVRDDEEDRYQDEQEKPVEVVVTHTPVCGHCQERS